MTPSKPRCAVLSKTKLMLWLPLSLLTGCASKLQPCQTVLQPLPEPPLMSTLQPPESYSARAQRNINQWQQRLTSTELMRK